MPDKLERFLPSLKWLKSYRAEDLPQDALAGFFVAVLLIPQSMAYALLADLPPQVGLYASILPPLVYALLGTSRFIAVGPVALVSLLAGEAIANAGGQVEPATAALVLAAMVGLILVLMGLLRMGFLVNFISDPVLTGFTSAVAVLIATSQLRNLFGLDISRGNFFETVTQILSQLGQINVVTTTIGLFTLLALILTNLFLGDLLKQWRFPRRWQIIGQKMVPLLLVILSTVVVWALGLQRQASVAVVGELGRTLPPLTLPPLQPALWLRFLLPSLAISVITYVTAMAVAKSLAQRRRQQLDSDQEALALGAANLLTAVTGGYTVGASVSRSAINFDMNAKTPAASAFTAGLVLLTVLLFAPFFYFLPKAMLAALIMTAVFSLFNLGAFFQIWRYSRPDAVSLLMTFGSVIALGVEWGIAIGALSGLALYLWRTSRPRIVVEGRVNDGHHFRSDERDTVEPLTSPVLVLRIDRSLYFANTGYCEDEFLKAVAEHNDVKYLLLDLKAVNEIDVSGYKMLDRLVGNLKEAGISLGLTEVKRPVQEILKKAGLLDLIGQDLIFLTTSEAVESLKARSREG